MRKLMFVLTLILAISSLLVPGTVQCADDWQRCQDVRWTCAQASAPVYNACISGGGSQSDCLDDERTFYQNCVTANNCPVKIE